MKQISIFLFIVSLSACNFKSEKNYIETISNLPSFNLLLLDSATKINTAQIRGGNPIILMWFSPDCEHCYQQTKKIVENINSLENAQIYLFSHMPLDELRVFFFAFHLDKYKNITVAKDYEYAFYKFYKPTGFPYTAIYSSQKKLIKLYKEEIEINQLVKAIHT